MVFIANCMASRKTAENSEKTAAASLFFRWPGRRRPRVSAVNEIRLADNLLEEQRKQREIAIIGFTPAVQPGPLREAEVGPTFHQSMD